MKQIVKNPASYFCFILALGAMFIFNCGCGASDPTPDPLSGFHFSSLNNLHSNKAINDDYQDYVRRLSPKDKDFVGAVDFLEDGTGQHAVHLTIGVGGTWSEHVLIYDKGNKRIKVIKYRNGGYRS